MISYMFEKVKEDEGVKEGGDGLLLMVGHVIKRIKKI